MSGIGAVLADEYNRVFGNLERGLTISLIATPVEDLLTCEVGDDVREVVQRGDIRDFDYIPVKDGDTFAGVFDRLRAKNALKNAIQVTAVKLVGSLMSRLSGSNLISGDAGILSFIEVAVRVSRAVPPTRRLA